MFEELKNFCDSFLDMGVPGFDLIVYKDGQCILRYQGGYADLKNKIPIKGDEKYNIYSCSKPITCVAAMQLWEKGLFLLDEPLSKYMPEFSEMTVKTKDEIKKAKNPILIKHLFEMTAGFSYDVYSPQLNQGRIDTDYQCPTREMMKYLAKEPLCFEPGEKYQYSLCHDVLAALVEVLSGENFEKYVQKNIFNPLGMENSTFVLPKSKRDTVCCKYSFDSKTGEVKEHGTDHAYNAYILGEAYASGGAGCVSTVEDYIKFLEALRIGNQILKTETLKLMIFDRLTEEQKSTYPFTNHGYGLGVRCPKKGDIHRDFGWGGAAGAYLSVDVENGISIFYAQHMLNSPNQQIRNLLYDYVMAEVTGKEEYITYIENTRSTDNYKYTY